jgi:hypothetical protein
MARRPDIETMPITIADTRVADQVLRVPDRDVEHPEEGEGQQPRAHADRDKQDADVSAPTQPTQFFVKAGEVMELRLIRVVVQQGGRKDRFR